MKTMTKVFRNRKYTAIIIILFMMFSLRPASAQQVDIGIFISGADQMEIRIKPDFQINPGQYFSDIRYTVRYPDLPGVSITAFELIFPFEMTTDYYTTDNGLQYQTFVNPSPNQFGVTINADEEVVISRFTYSGGPSVYFFIEDNAYTTDSPYPPDNAELFYNFDLVCDNPVSGICDDPDPNFDPAIPLDITGVFYQPYATIPVSNWAIILAVGFILAFTVFSLRRIL